MAHRISTGYARSMRTTVVLCRGPLKHAWEEFSPLDPPTWHIRGGTELNLRCVRCGTERYDLVSPVSGSLYGRKYNYPDGYAAPKGERPSMQQLRVEALQRRKKNG